MYVLTNANRYISAYRNPKLFAGEPQYFFTKFFSAVTFIYELNNASRLSNITQKEFKLGMENCDVMNNQIQQLESNESFKKSNSEFTNESEKANDKVDNNNHIKSNGNHLNGSENNKMHSGSADENLIDFESSITTEQKPHLPSLSSSSSSSSNDQILVWMKENIQS